jgi:dTDP-4-amino-4,6-dideoxygalactose transaminase
MKQQLDDLALLGGSCEFQTVKPVSNLPKPSFEVFTHYLSIANTRHQWTNNGFLNHLLEQQLAQFHGVQHCVTFASGFWALAAMMNILAITGKTEVVMPSMTYRRMADIAAWANMTPHFCDIDAISMTNTAACVRPCLNDNTALIMGVHPVNGLADIDALTDLGQEFKIPLIFDSVESVYECHHQTRIGAFGEAEVFSLGASKLINGFEGGYITTNHAWVAQAAKQAHQQFNSNLSEVHAAMALAGLEDIDQQIVRNAHRYQAYRQHLEGIDGIELLTFDLAHRPGYKNIMIKVRDSEFLTRNHIVDILNAEKILARAYYPQPLHLKKTSYAQISDSLPNTESMCHHYILMPCGEQVCVSEVKRICDVLAFIKQNEQALSQKLSLSPRS